MHWTTIGIDLSKTVFQLSLADSRHRIVDRRRLSRRHFSRFLATAEPARLVMEACSTAHYWSRIAQQHGHRVKLLHAHYVRPYVRRNKTDSADADALLRADHDKDLKPVPTKNEHQQALQSLHRIRAQWKKTRTARICCAKALLAEFGVSMPRGVKDLALRLRQAADNLPHVLQGNFHTLVDEIVQLNERLQNMDRDLNAVLPMNPMASGSRASVVSVRSPPPP